MAGWKVDEDKQKTEEKKDSILYTYMGVEGQPTPWWDWFCHVQKGQDPVKPTTHLIIIIIFTMYDGWGGGGWW